MQRPKAQEAKERRLPQTAKQHLRQPLHRKQPKRRSKHSAQAKERAKAQTPLLERNPPNPLTPSKKALRHSSLPTWRIITGATMMRNSKRKLGRPRWAALERSSGLAMFATMTASSRRASKSLPLITLARKSQNTTPKFTHMLRGTTPAPLTMCHAT